MANYKLILRILGDVAEKGKFYAKRHKKSHSKLIEDQISQLTSSKSPQINESIPDNLLFIKGLAKINLANDEVYSRWDHI